MNIITRFITINCATSKIEPLCLVDTCMVDTFSFTHSHTHTLRGEALALELAHTTAFLSCLFSGSFFFSVTHRRFRADHGLSIVTLSISVVVRRRGVCSIKSLLDCLSLFCVFGCLQFDLDVPKSQIKWHQARRLGYEPRLNVSCSLPF